MSEVVGASGWWWAKSGLVTGDAHHLDIGDIGAVTDVDRTFAVRLGGAR